MAVHDAPVGEDFVIPRQSGTAFPIRKGQVLRITQIAGPQTADLIAYRLDDMRERFSAVTTRVANRDPGTRKLTRLTTLHAGPPTYSVMFRLVHDPVGRHHLSVSGGCSRLSYEMTYGDGNVPNCQDILTRAIEPFGLTGYDLVTPIGLFMNVEFAAGPWGEIVIRPPLAKQGDHIDLVAEMDLLVALAACPNERETNGFEAKPLGVRILGGAPDAPPAA